MHLSTFFVYRVSGAYCGFMVLVLLSKIEESDTSHPLQLKYYVTKMEGDCGLWVPNEIV